MSIHLRLKQIDKNSRSVTLKMDTSTFEVLYRDRVYYVYKKGTMIASDPKLDAAVLSISPYILPQVEKLTIILGVGLAERSDGECTIEFLHRSSGEYCFELTNDICTQDVYTNRNGAIMHVR